ncbi:MAG: OmpA family protein [Deltaproteobacteria bacterium]|nr:OmpA family protein [Deltaproteobacteria bacterium]
MKRYITMALLIALAVFIAACAARPIAPPSIQYNEHTPKCLDNKYTYKVGNYYILLDASVTMASSYKNRVKLTQAKEMVALINSRLPDKNINFGLRTYGQRIAPFDDETELVYGIAKFDKEAIDEVLGKITDPMGRSPLIYAINAATEDLKSTKGKIAVIVITDARKIEEYSVRAGELMRRELGDRVYLHTIQIGNDVEGAKTLEKLAAGVGTGVSVTADYLRTDEEAMSRFMCFVFIAPDADGDGVADDDDWCPDTPEGMSVDAVGCPTAPLAAVVEQEAPAIQEEVQLAPEVKEFLQKKRMVLNVLFLFDRWDVRPRFHDEIAGFAEILKRYPDMNVVIEGHTDSWGPDAYNEVLSGKRAESIKQYIVEKFGIDAARIRAIGYGEKRPVADNKTFQGRQLNRRIEAAIDFEE